MHYAQLTGVFEAEADIIFVKFDDDPAAVLIGEEVVGAERVGIRG